MADFTADADIRGQQIDLSLAWSDPAGVARSLRLLRRRFGYPTDPRDGLLLLDLADLFVVPPPLMVTDATNVMPIQITTGQPHGLSTGAVVEIADVTGNTAANGEWTIFVTGLTTFELTGSKGSGLYASGGVVSQPPTTTPWGRIDRTRCYLLDDLAEGGILQAELARYYVNATNPEPVQVAVTAYYPPPLTSSLPDDRAVLRSVISSVTHVDTATGSNASYGLVTTITIYANPGGGPEKLAGTLVVSTQGVSPGPTTAVLDYTQPDPITDQPLQISTAQPSPSQLVWTPIWQKVTGASFTSPIEITTPHPHGLSTGATVVISSVVGNDAANGAWTIAVTGPTTFTLSGSVGNGAYTPSTGEALPVATTLPFLVQELQCTGSTLRAIQPLVADFVTGVVTMTVTGATFTTPIQITTASPHGLSDDAKVVILDVTGNTAANGEWLVVVTGPTTFTLMTLMRTPSAGSGPWAGGGVVALPIRSVEFTETQNPDTGEISRSIDAVDLEPPTRALSGFSPGLDTGVTYYYAAWQDTGGGYPAAPIFSAFSIATGSHGFSDRLYSLLPAVHRFYDDPASGPQPGSGLPGSWQLRRFLQVMGPALDQGWSTAEALRTLSDVFEVRADDLPLLGHWIGWELDRTRSTQRQRTDILFAPDVFQSVGTLHNIEALVHRSTGWACQAKEFVNNVFLTNFVEPIRLCEIWQAPPVSGPPPSYPLPYPLPALPPPVQTPVTQAVNDSIDARPALAIEPSVTPPQWLFWHSRRPDTHTPPSTRRQIWMQSFDATYPLTTPSVTMRPVMQGAPDDGPDLTYSDEWPTAIADGSVVRLFWISDRKGSPAVWTRILNDGVPPPPPDPNGNPIQLTQHPAGDHCPFVVKDATGTFWVFFHSNRRGPTDIWAITLPSGPNATWSQPVRITTGQPRDQMPTAFVDATNQLNLLWSADLGDRSRILQATLSGGVWTVNSTSVSSASGDTATYRDEAPTAVRWNGQVWAYWSSNRDGISRIYASKLTPPSTWSTPVPVTSGRHEEAEPAAFVDAAGALRLVYRSTQGGEQYRSRTVDMQNLGAIKRGLVDDRWHYTYSNQLRIDFNNDPNSVAFQQDSPYARDAVGLYVTPGANQNLDDTNRVKVLVEPFRPLPVIFTWHVQPALVIESVYSPIDIHESWSTSPGPAPGFSWIDDEDFLGPITDATTVSLPNWSLFYTNTLGDVSGNPANLQTLWHRTWYPGFH